MKIGNIVGTSTFRVVTIAGLVLVLLIPMGMIESVIYERSHLYRQANDEVKASWGNEQRVIGPVISLPYLRQSTEQGVWSYKTLYKHVRPVMMDMEIQVDTQLRYRSIYEVLLYTAHVRITGTFDLSKIRFHDDTTEFELDEGYLQVPMGSPRSIKQITGLTWDDIALETQPQFLGNNSQLVTLTANMDPELLANDNVHEFALEYVLTGSGEISFINHSPKSELQINSNWGTPGFFGNYLPDSHSIADQHFQATWQINELLGDIENNTTQWLSIESLARESWYGIRFIQPVDTYQQVTRSAKYAVLFIGLVFLVYFFTEILSGLHLHPIQYILVGGANCVFYLLLLSLAEHISFFYAYLLSAVASILIVSLYSLSILQSRSNAIVILCLLGALYIYLFITLTSRAYALLIGSVGLFAILALVMYLTRNVEWHKVSLKKSI